MDLNDLRVIGIIVAAHGLQGTAKVQSLSDYPGRFLDLKNCFIVKDDSFFAEVTVKRVKLATSHVLITFGEYSSREEIEALRGYELCIPGTDSIRLPADVFFISDLIGYSGIGADGAKFGTLLEVVSGPQDLLKFEIQGGELLIPFVDEWVGEIDNAARTIEVPYWKVLFESQKP